MHPGIARWWRQQMRKNRRGEGHDNGDTDCRTTGSRCAEILPDVGQSMRACYRAASPTLQLLSRGRRSRSKGRCAAGRQDATRIRSAVSSAIAALASWLDDDTGNIAQLLGCDIMEAWDNHWKSQTIKPCPRPNDSVICRPTVKTRGSDLVPEAELVLPLS